MEQPRPKYRCGNSIPTRRPFFLLHLLHLHLLLHHSDSVLRFDLAKHSRAIRGIDHGTSAFAVHTCPDRPRHPRKITTTELSPSLSSFFFFISRKNRQGIESTFTSRSSTEDSMRIHRDFMFKSQCGSENLGESIFHDFPISARSDDVLRVKVKREGERERGRSRENLAFLTFTSWPTLT